ncbi:MAG: ammonia-forming cytochrome c nitrite reductase subunit c552 [Leptospiraceae bacterium]|nr:ammonia-forming cytochrome c nitrite reductase subunit c552 [Leptospiraceae bacterium]
MKFSIKNFLKNFTESPRAGRNLVILLVGSLGLGIFCAWLVADIATKREQGRNAFFRVTEITEESHDPAIWGQNFPYQFASYKKTADMNRTRFGGSEAMPRTPTSADPRSIVSQSKLEEDPRLVSMWAGYAFSKDFREERGHAYMLEDQIYTERQKVGQPGTCSNCHASVYPVYKKLGDGDIMKGFHKLNAMPYSEAKEHLKHPVACIDCHVPADMSLRVTRPAFIEGMKRFKASKGIKNYDVNTMASRKEMRSYVCGQCHVEYYFKGKEKTLTYPWDNGQRADDIYAYYQKIGFADWTHAKTKAKVLKAQHPEFEMYSQGLHARSGVACADCHMPYERQGNIKVTNHHVKSPYNDVQASCGGCHPIPANELKARIDIIQDNTAQMRNIAFDALIALIKDIEVASDKKSAASLEKAKAFQREAQFLFDFVEAENSMGFHAPQEAMRVLGLSIDASRKGQVSLR